MRGYVYLASADRGLKIGYSNDPATRLKSVAFEIGVPVTLVYHTAPLDSPERVEAMAHWLLRDSHLGGEWFSSDEEAARLAIASAVEMVEAGEVAPRRINNATPYADLKEERVQFIAQAVWLWRVDEWRRAQKGIPSRSKAIRALVDQALDREL